MNCVSLLYRHLIAMMVALKVHTLAIVQILKSSNWFLASLGCIAYSSFYITACSTIKSTLFISCHIYAWKENRIRFRYYGPAAQPFRYFGFRLWCGMNDMLMSTESENNFSSWVTDDAVLKCIILKLEKKNWIIKRNIFLNVWNNVFQTFLFNCFH